MNPWTMFNKSFDELTFSDFMPLFQWDLIQPNYFQNSQ